MYTYREEKYNKATKSHKDMPSFSSTLLDEIYRSIDGGAEKSEDLKAFKDKPVKKQSGYYYRTKTNIIQVEEKTSLRRACLVEKWMDKGENNEKVVPKKNPNLELEKYKSSLHDNNNDVLFFSSTSSSNSDSSGALSSSDTEFFASQTEPKVSCFSTRPKPVRTGVSARENKRNQQDHHYSLFGRENKIEDDSSVKYKSRALKMYANLKKMKQPISPGGRLTSLINSLFSNANGKKSKNIDTSKKFQSPNKAQSACSFSRSCLSKYSPRSRERMRNIGTDQRTVRFHPVSVIVDEDSRPCGHKCIYDDDEDEEGISDKNGKPPLPINIALMADLKLSKMEKNRKLGENAQNNNNNNKNKRRNDFSMFRKINGGDDDHEDDDGISDSSSDLFELDHLAFFGNNRFREELPVYETTRYLDTNRAIIASRLIR